jgi:hypothetical protein
VLYGGTLTVVLPRGERRQVAPLAIRLAAANLLAAVPALLAARSRPVQLLRAE